MLQQILKDMYIDPDVLDALNEDQKKTLFLKMRQEQVRRWQEREDKLEREGGDAVKRTKPKKADSKSVSWLLGRDGDVAVIVIGEVDELSAKFICSGLEEKKSPPSLQNNSNNQSILTNRKTTEPNRTERETISTVTYGLQVNKVSVSEHSSPPAADKIESKVASKPQEKFAPHTSICSRPPLRASPVDVTAASATAAPGSPYSRPGAAGPRLTAATLLFSSSSTAKTEPGNTSKAPCTQENHKPQEAPRSKDGASSRVTVRSALEDAVSSGNVSPPCAGRGRVAQLMKAFNTESSAGPPQTPGQTPTRGTKPPLPIKPSHLRATTTPSVR